MQSDPATNPAHAARQIRSIRSVAELDGYEAQARQRGIAAHETTLIAERRLELTGGRG